MTGRSRFEPLPRDGLRAKCSRFVSRSDYRGRSCLSCGGKKLMFEHREARDRWYECMCCGEYRKCGMRVV